MSETFVIVGAGLAGAKAAETLRAEGFGGNVVLVGEEEHAPYERPPLSKAVLQGKEGPDSALVHPAAWYPGHGIELRLGEAATALDLGGRVVRLASGDELRYDKLLLATGAVPRPLSVPGAEGVLYLRTLGQSATLRAQLRPGARLLVVGAGWIGLEVAAAAREAGAEVTVVEVAELPLERVLGREVAPVFAQLHREHGVDLRLGTGVHSFTATGGALLSDGTELQVDAVLAGIGVAPADALAKAAGLVTNNGIVVDDHLRTSDENVYAVGDVANFPSALYGQRIRVEHWANALNGGPAAGRAMLGGTDPYDPVPYFYTDQYDLGMEYAGHIPTGGYDNVVFRGDPATREFIVFWLAGGRLLAGMNVNVWDVSEDIQRIVRSQQPVDVAKLTDPAVPLSDL